MTTTQKIPTKVTDLRSGDRFVLSARGRKVYTAYNAPIVRRGYAVVRTSPRAIDDALVFPQATSDMTVYVIKEK